MKKKEYDNCYIYQLEKIKDYTDEEMFETEIDDGWIVTFGKKEQNSGSGYQFLEVEFSKEYYYAKDADDLWRSYKYWFVPENVNVDKKYPLCKHITYVPKKGFVLTVIRNMERKMSLKEQILRLDAGEDFESDIIAEELEKFYKEEEKKGLQVHWVNQDTELPVSGSKHLIKDFKKLIRGKGVISNEKFSDKTEEDKIVGAISIINAQSLSVLPNDEDIIEFIEYFYKKYGENKRLFKQMERNWPYKPRIFRLAERAEERLFEKKMEEKYENLSATKKRMVNKFIDYLFALPLGFHVSFTYGYDDYSCAFKVESDFSDEDIEGAKKEIRYITIETLLTGGAATIRYSIPDFDKEIVSGIRAKGQKFETVSASEMQWCMENQPDGYHTYPDEIYKRPEVFF